MDNKELKEEILKAFLVALDEGKGTRAVALTAALASCGTPPCTHPKTLSNTQRYGNQDDKPVAGVGGKMFKNIAARTAYYKDAERKEIAGEDAAEAVVTASDEAKAKRHRQGIKAVNQEAAAGTAAAAGGRRRESFAEQIRTAVLNYLKENREKASITPGSDRVAYQQAAKHTVRRFGPKAIPWAPKTSQGQTRALINQDIAVRRHGPDAHEPSGKSSADQAEGKRQFRHSRRRFPTTDTAPRPNRSAR